MPAQSMPVGVRLAEANPRLWIRRKGPPKKLGCAAPGRLEIAASARTAVRRSGRDSRSWAFKFLIARGFRRKSRRECSASSANSANLPILLGSTIRLDPGLITRPGSKLN